MKRIVVIMLTVALASFSASVLSGEDTKQIAEDEMWISGRIIWSEHDLTQASVEVFRDPQFKDLYTRGLLTKPDGIYTLSISEPGTYYIVAFVDNNGNNKFDAGDGMGMYGVTDWADAGQKIKPLKLEKGMKLPGIDIQITAVADEQSRMVPISSLEAGVVTGVSGKLIWPNPPDAKDDIFSNAIVFAYSDPSWNNRIAQAKVGKNGEYEVSVPAGRYYILAVIDENVTNLLDAGDKFGIWGMTRFGMFPKAVNVSDGSITKDRNILIVGQMGIAGKPMPLQGTPANAETAVAPDDRVSVSGNVLWPGHAFKFAVVQVYSDPSMTMAVVQAKSDDKGRFRFMMPAGEYYILAAADADGDGKYTKGDGIGAYGVANAADEMPKKFKVTKDSQNAEINLVITAEFDASGQLKSIIPDTSLKTQDIRLKNQETGFKIQEYDTQPTGVSGKILWEGCSISKATLVFSNKPGFENGTSVPLQLGDDGLYSCLTPPGDYYIMAIMDRNSNDQVDAGDGLGFYGAGYWGEPQKVTVLSGKMTNYININVNTVIGTDGKTSSIKTPGSIRLHYGEPDTINTDSSGEHETQEWWYWSKGLSFTFEKIAAGWNLVNTYEFTPIGEDISSLSKGESSNGNIYYTYDKNIWAINADGKNRRWITPGTRPTATSDGSKLLFLDTGGYIYLIKPESNEPAQSVLSRRNAGIQPAISHNGKAVAFTQEGGGYSQIILKKLETNEESPIPSGNMNLYYPSWSSDDQLVAYSASPASTDQADRSRDIYYYELATGRTERISTSPLDDFDPAWSPVDKRVLVYCRAEDDHSQLWIVNFDANGKPLEHQLTKNGGQNPAWSPKGDRIVYENNSQLWTINPDGADEGPIVVDGETIFGLDPFWTQ